MVLGLDIGGTKIAATLVGPTGRVVASRWSAHSARGVEAVAAAIAATAGELPAATHPVAGVAVGGLVSCDGEVTAAGLELICADLVSAISLRIGAGAVVINDAQATLRAAVEQDPDGPFDDVALLTLGTGVGGAIVRDGRPLHGRRGLAGELGHLPVRPASGDRCVCGSSGCLEQFAGGRGISARARAAAGAGLADNLVAHAGRAAHGLTAREVVAAARDGSPAALALIDDAADCIAAAVVMIAVAVEPAKVYLSGSLGHAGGDLLLPRIVGATERRWPFAATIPRPAIAVDDVGPFAAAIGAALTARDCAPDRREVA